METTGARFDSSPHEIILVVVLRTPVCRKGGRAEQVCYNLGTKINGSRTWRSTDRSSMRSAFTTNSSPASSRPIGVIFAEESSEICCEGNTQRVCSLTKWRLNVGGMRNGYGRRHQLKYRWKEASTQSICQKLRARGRMCQETCDILARRNSNFQSLNPNCVKSISRCVAVVHAKKSIINT